MFAEYSLNVRYVRCLDPNIKRTYEFFCLSPWTFSECSVKVSIHRSSTVMFAEYSLNVRYNRCLDPNIKRTYEFFCLSPGTFSECSAKVSIQIWGLKTLGLSYTGGLPLTKFAYTGVLYSFEYAWVQLSTREYSWVRMSTAEYAWVQLSTHEYNKSTAEYRTRVHTSTGVAAPSRLYFVFVRKSSLVRPSVVHIL